MRTATCPRSRNINCQRMHRPTPSSSTVRSDALIALRAACSPRSRLVEMMFSAALLGSQSRVLTLVAARCTLCNAAAAHLVRFCSSRSRGADSTAARGDAAALHQPTPHAVAAAKAQGSRSEHNARMGMRSGTRVGRKSEASSSPAPRPSVSACSPLCRFVCWRYFLMWLLCGA